MTGWWGRLASNSGEAPSVTPGPQPEALAGADRDGFAKEEGRAALMPYMMAGYPDRETSLAVAEAYAESADLIELGIPFSDPLADGPTIHAAATAALEAGATLETALEICEAISDRVPVVFMVYANMVLAHGGAAEFAERGAERWGCRGDRAGSAVGGSRGGAGGFCRGRAGAGAAGGADHAACSPRPHLRCGPGVRLRGLDRGDHGRARGVAGGSCRADAGDQGRGGGAGRGGVRDRHAGAGGRGRARSPTG